MNSATSFTALIFNCRTNHDEPAILHFFLLRLMIVSSLWLCCKKRSLSPSLIVLLLTSMSVSKTYSPVLFNWLHLQGTISLTFLLFSASFPCIIQNWPERIGTLLVYTLNSVDTNSSTFIQLFLTVSLSNLAKICCNKFNLIRKLTNADNTLFVLL